MKYIEPDFYPEFKCIAAKCRHSCCKGWEIDIDDKSLEKYKSVPGKLGENLRNNISFEGVPHFKLTAEERCPFFEPSGLCSLILKKGEDILCDICREHPRFYNFYSNREERGVGLCCEEAVRLLLNTDEPLKFRVYNEAGEEEDKEAEEAEILFRDRVLEFMSRRDFPLENRLQNILYRCNGRLIDFDFKYWAELFLSFEQMDESWTALLRVSLQCPESDISSVINNPRYERLISYFIYRHFGNFCYEYDIADSLIFCILSGAFIAALDLNFGENPEHIRLYSSEIEYSVENIGFIMDKISKTQQ